MGLNTEIIIKGNEDRTTVLHSLAEKHQSNRLNMHTLHRMTANAVGLRTKETAGPEN